MVSLPICVHCGKSPCCGEPTAGASSRPEGVSPEGPTDPLLVQYRDITQGRSVVIAETPDPRTVTHSEGCWAWHPTCAQDRIRAIIATLKREDLHDYDVLELRDDLLALIRGHGAGLRGMP